MGACPSDDMLAVFAGKRGGRMDAIEGHLDGCAPCRALVAQLAAVEADQRQHALDVAPSASTVRTVGVPPTLASEGATAAPARVSRYVVERELGRGGMGIVLLAHDPDLDRKVAVKVVRGHAGDEKARARLLREARAMARLAHPNVVAIHDVGTTAEGEVFLAMELVHGPTLRGLLASRGRSVSELIELFVQAGRDLAAAHAAGLVHRDFKPENVLVGADGRVRVTDFGLAREDAEPLSSALTARGVVVGTPAYMAPEQHVGAATTDRADQYAFCVALFEALTGERPHAGRSFEEITASKLHDQRRPWPAAPVVPAEVRAAIDRGLARDAAERHPSMAALVAILERARGAAPGPPVAMLPLATQMSAPPLPAQTTATSPAPMPAPMPMHAPAPMPMHAPAPMHAPMPMHAPAPVPMHAPMPTHAPVLATRARMPAPPLRMAPVSRAPFFIGLGLALMALLLIAGWVLYRTVRIGSLFIGAPATTQVPEVAARPEELSVPAIPAFRPLAQSMASASNVPCPAGATMRTVPTRSAVECVRGDKREGLGFRFHPNGVLAEQATYRADQRDGKSFTLNDDGKLYEISDYVAGQLDGVVLKLDPRGAVQSERHYKNGKKNGLLRLWSDGKLIAIERYEDGRLVEDRPIPDAKGP